MANQFGADRGGAQLDDIAAGTAKQTAAPEASIPWPLPKPIRAELHPVRQLDPSMLPTRLSDFVFDEAARMPCAPDYIAASLIVALGSLIGASCALKPKRHDDSWLVTPNLWGGIVGEPSSKKSPAIGVAMKNLDRLEAAEAIKLEEKEAAHAAELAAFKAHENAIQTAMKKALSDNKLNSGEKDSRLASAKHELAMLRPPEPPYQRRFKSNDCTTEKLGELLADNPVGLLVVRDELTGLLVTWDKEGREGDRAFYLEGWNGIGSFSIDRIARGSLFIQNLCLSVFGGIQPDLLERYLDSMVNSLDNDGRMQRFQVMVYPDAVPWTWQDRAAGKNSRAAVRDIFDHLAHFDPVMDGAAPADEYVKLPHFSFDDEAQEFFITWSHELHTIRIPAESNPLVRQHLAKYEKLFCALCLIFHLVDGRIGVIGLDTAIRAAGYCEYLESHARRIYGLVETARVTAAQVLSRRLSEGKLPDGFTVRDVRRKQWGGLTTTPQVEAALDILEDYGWTRSIEIGPSQAGGRPTTVYLINPHARRNGKQ